MQQDEPVLGRRALEEVVRPRLPADEAWAFDAMRRGEDFAAICEGLCGFVEPDRAAFRAAGLVKTWIEADSIPRFWLAESYKTLAPAFG